MSPRRFGPGKTTTSPFSKGCILMRLTRNRISRPGLHKSLYGELWSVYGREAIMSWWEAASWGFAGGLAAGVLALMTAVISAGFHWWPRDERGPRLFVLGCGLLLGALVAAAMHGDMSGIWPAFVIGAGAPATIRGLLSGVEVHVKPPPGNGARTTAAGKLEPTGEEVSENAG